MSEPPEPVITIEDPRLGRSCTACGADNDGVRALVIGSVQTSYVMPLCLPCRRRCAEVLAASCVVPLAVGCEVEWCATEERPGIWHPTKGSRFVEDQGTHRVFRLSDGEYRRMHSHLVRAVQG